MPLYSFKKQCQVYIVYGGSKYKIEVYPDLNFSQTFDEQTINVKTLHDQTAMFEDAVINRANPANFEFTVMLVTGNDFKILGDLLTVSTNSTGSDEALGSFDVYVDTGVDIFRLQKCVFERGTFQFVRDQIVTVSLQGSGAQLTRFGISGTTIPGTTVARDASHTGFIPYVNLVELDGQVMQHISGVTLELANQINWLEYDTLHKSLNVTDASDTMYPEAFVVSNKVLSGTIRQYVTDVTNSSLNTWSTNSTLRIRVGNAAGVYFLDVNMPTVVFTNRIEPGDIFIQSYDFRMKSNSGLLQNIINYNL